MQIFQRMDMSDSLIPVGDDPVAVLVSGGLDSAVLVGDAMRTQKAVYPLYIRCGLIWEEVELACLKRFLAAIKGPRLKPLHILEMPVADLYPEQHWSLKGKDVPDAQSADEAVYLPGRNVLLLSKAIIWCHLNQVAGIAMAPLESNPFPDATPAFFNNFSGVVNQAIEGNVKLFQPYLGLKKKDVVKRGKGMPMELTLSCIKPIGGIHCGQCNKCAERKKGFMEAGVTDPTSYHQ